MLSFCLLSPRWQARALKLRRWDKSQLSHSVQRVQMYCPQHCTRVPVRGNNKQHGAQAHMHQQSQPLTTYRSSVQCLHPPQHVISALIKLSAAATYFVYQHYKIVSLYLMTELGDLHPHNSDADHVQGGEETLNFKLTHFNSKWWLSRFFDSLNFVQIVKVK